MAGFECSKLNPDAGVDFLVTNVARRRVSDEPSMTIELQVKSALLREGRRNASGTFAGEAGFWMSMDDRDYLVADPARVTAFVVFHSLRQMVHPDSFSFPGSTVDRSVDQDGADHRDRILAENGRRLPDGSKQSILRINRFETESFWLNGRQLERTIDAGHWKDGKDDLVGLIARLHDGGLSLGGAGLLPEARELTCMLGCRAEARLAEGCFSYDHL